MPRRGDQFGQYTLINKLGRGTFGEVWLADKQSALISTQFALKLPNDEDVDIDVIRQEASLWQSVSGHPNILPFIEADIYDNQIVIVTQYLKDGDLTKWLEVNGGKAPSNDETLKIIFAILDGLEHLHSKGIIHRDLKPSNILLQDGRPKIADFGISRMLKATANSSTLSAGTPLYMPPEAFEGKRLFETDIWSVGVIFQKLLTGYLPFDEPDPIALMYAILQKDPRPLSQDVPSNFRKIISTCLQKDPEKRFNNISAMRNALKVNSDDYGLRKESLNLHQTNDNSPNHQNFDYKSQVTVVSEKDSESTVISNKTNPKPTEAKTAIIPQESLPNQSRAKTNRQIVNLVDNDNVKNSTNENVESVLPKATKPTNKRGFKLAVFGALSMIFFLGLASVSAFVYLQYFNLDAEDYFLQAFECKTNDCRLENYDKAIEKDKDFAAAYFARSSIYFINQSFEKSQQDKDELGTLDPNHDKSLKSYNKVLEKYPNSFFGLLNRATIHSNNENHDLALIDLDKAISIEPNNFAGYNNRGSYYNATNKADEAIKDFSKAIELESKHPIPYFNRGTTLSYKGECKNAIVDFDKAIDANPAFTGAYFVKAACLTELKQYNTAHKLFEKLISNNPTDFRIYLYRSKNYSAQKKYAPALEDIDRAIDLKKDHAESYDEQGRIHYAKKEFKAAVDSYTKAIGISSDDGFRHNSRGVVYYAAKQHENAISDYTKAIELNPTFSEFYYNRGFVYDDTKQYENSISDYTKAIKLNPKYSDAYNNRGIVYEKINKLKLAKRDFKASEELEKNKNKF